MEQLEWCYDAIPRAATQQLNIIATVSYDKEQKRFWISDQSSGRAWWADFDGSGSLQWTFTEVTH